jgi:hypothetical protein
MADARWSACRRSSRRGLGVVPGKKSVGWVERNETHHVSAQGFDGYRFAPPILHSAENA